MPKNIVLCLDGTWNHKDDPDLHTNVAILHDMCLLDKNRQIAYYDTGVGTRNVWYDEQLGGVYGLGLSAKIRAAYSFLSQYYEDGDKVFLFGFSRGAFSVRSLSGLLYRCGLTKPLMEDSQELVDLFNAYAWKDYPRMADMKASNRFCPIEMIGVWDTVGALGIPVSFLRRPSEVINSFHDTRLSPEVKQGRHALAVDEKRAFFLPTLWHQSPENKNRIKQVWFAGVHADVGGGYRDNHHSDVPLKWMLGEAKQCGLLIKEKITYQFRPDLSQDIHNSAYKLFGNEVAVQEREAYITPDYTPKVHNSMIEKLRLCPDYKPLALWKHLDSRETLSPYEVIYDFDFQ